MTQLSTAGNVFSTAAQLATATQKCLAARGVGVYPTGIKTSTDPYEITYSSDKKDLAAPTPLLHVPHFGMPSPLKEFFIDDDMQEQGSLPETYNQLQKTIDGAMMRLDDMTDPSTEVDEKADALLLDSDGHADKLLEAAVLLSSRTGVQESIRRAVDLFTVSAKIRAKGAIIWPAMASPDLAESRDAQALVMQLALAALDSMEKPDPKRRLAYAEKVRDLWHNVSATPTRQPDYVTNDSVRIFVGLVENFADDVDIDNSYVALQKHLRIADLLKRSNQQHLKNNRQNLAAKDSCRRLWTLFKAASLCDSYGALMCASRGLEEDLKDASWRVSSETNGPAELTRLATEAKGLSAMLASAAIAADEMM